MVLYTKSCPLTVVGAIHCETVYKLWRVKVLSKVLESPNLIFMDLSHGPCFGPCWRSSFRGRILGLRTCICARQSGHVLRPGMRASISGLKKGAEDSKRTRKVTHYRDRNPVRKREPWGWCFSQVQVFPCVDHRQDRNQRLECYRHVTSACPVFHYVRSTTLCECIIMVRVIP